MGTRGLVGFVIDGEVKASYNHFDSYPTGLGCDVVKAVNAGIDADKVRALRMVKEDQKPTVDEQANLLKHANLGVSTGNPAEWYVLLRDLQGDLLGTLDAGYMIDSLNFAADSLFCEWGYLVNLDTETVEVYRGFVKDQSRGRFATMDFHKDHRVEQYLPITLLREVPFTQLTDAVMQELENEVYDSDEE